MRYAQWGGYTPAEQQRRERLRLLAAGRFRPDLDLVEPNPDLPSPPPRALRVVQRVAPGVQHPVPFREPP
jgi:hypothetical protein